MQFTVLFIITDKRERERVDHLSRISALGQHREACKLAGVLYAHAQTRPETTSGLYLIVIGTRVMVGADGCAGSQIRLALDYACNQERVVVMLLMCREYQVM